MPQVITVPFSSQLIGQGYNTATGAAVGTALEVGSVFEDTSTSGQAGDTAFDYAASQDSLYESLGMQVSADVSVGLFDASAKLSFSDQHAVNTFSTFIAGRSFIQNATRHGKDFTLTPAAAALIASGQKDNFKTAFGDMFVRSLGTGGEFCVIARVTSVSEEHQQAVSAALHAEYNGLAASGSFDAALQKAMVETHDHTEVAVKMLQLGGQGGQLAYTGAEAANIIQRLKDLPAFVHDHAWGLSVELASYDIIPLPIPPPEEGADRDLVLRDCAEQKQKFLKAIGDLDLALDPTTSHLFENLPSGDQLSTDQSGYREALNALMAHAIKIATGEIDPPTEFVATLPPPDLGFLKIAPFAAKSAVEFLGDWQPKAGQTSHFGKITVFPKDDSAATVQVLDAPGPGVRETHTADATVVDGALTFSFSEMVVGGKWTWTFTLIKTDAVTIDATTKIVTPKGQFDETETSVWSHAD